MTSSQPHTWRILAIDPTASGLGFVVLEGADDLIDWGIRLAKGEKNIGCVRIIETLILRYNPNIIVVENCQTKGCFRGQRVKDLIEDISALAKARRIECQRVTWLTIQNAFSRQRAFKKYQIAAELAGQFPELTRHLPRPRRPWTSEDMRMSIFDALALATATMKKR
jgi:hypothetical protein